jgi:DNA-binding transcriptional LysR family regulator
VLRADLELRQLRVLLAVLDSGGYSRAASALTLAQSTVSETIASLERSLGAPLLRREGRSVFPTEAGEVLVGYARKLVALAAEAAAKTRLAHDHARPPLVLGAADSIGSYLLPAALASLRATHPHARTSVRTGACDEIRGWLREGKIELGLLIEPLRGRAKRTGASSVLGESQLVLCGRPRAGAFGARELRRATVHMDGQEGLYQNALRASLHGAGAPMPPVHAAGSMEGVKRAVLSSADAVGVLPAFVVATEVGRGELVLLPLDPPLPLLRIEAIWQGGRASAPRALVTDLLALLRGALAAPRGAPRRARR